MQLCFPAAIWPILQDCALALGPSTYLCIWCQAIAEAVNMTGTQNRSVSCFDNTVELLLRWVD